MSEFEITQGFTNYPDISKPRTAANQSDAGYIPMVEGELTSDDNTDKAKIDSQPQTTDKKPTYEEIIGEIPFKDSQINPSDLTPDKIKTLFPPPVYDVNRSSDTQFYVYESNSGECLYEVAFTDSGFNVRKGREQTFKFNNKGQLTDYDKTGDGFYVARFANEQLYYERYFDENQGRVVEKNIVVDKLASVFGNSSAGGVSKSEIKHLITDMVTPENAEEIALEYYNKTGRDLMEDITRASNLLSDDEILQGIDHINNCFYDPNFKKENSKVVNKDADYEGDTYTVSQSGNIMTIVNNDRNETHTLDLDKLCKNLSPTDRARIIKMLQQMPAEVLVDISIEVDIELDKKGSNQGRSGYDSWNDKIVLGKKDFKLQSLIHEIGHALDAMATHGRYRTIMKSSANINAAFEEEITAYEKAGHKRHDEDYDYSKNRWDPQSLLKNTPGDYATWNNVEMFAECYTLIMTGNCTSKNIILQYFPKTLQAAKESILWARQQSINDRRLLD